jgi:asparagine synthase (glutamine-hydrolysing)
MVPADGGFVITYNGEVYSYPPIGAELAGRGCKFRGHSDTEVILESFAVNGIEPTLKRMIGMFAIALWNRREHTPTPIRDRLGIKPLYSIDVFVATRTEQTDRSGMHFRSHLAKSECA